MNKEQVISCHNLLSQNNQKRSETNVLSVLVAFFSRSKDFTSGVIHLILDYAPKFLPVLGGANPSLIPSSCCLHVVCKFLRYISLSTSGKTSCFSLKAWPEVFDTITKILLQFAASVGLNTPLTHTCLLWWCCYSAYIHERAGSWR